LRAIDSLTTPLYLVSSLAMTWRLMGLLHVDAATFNAAP
jgi:hypothetical protein